MKMISGPSHQTFGTELIWISQSRFIFEVDNNDDSYNTDVFYDWYYFEHFQKIAMTEQQKDEMRLQISESSEGEAEVEERVSR